MSECNAFGGCHYLKSPLTGEEYCKISKEATKGAVQCDFEYEDCEFGIVDLKEVEAFVRRVT